MIRLLAVLVALSSAASAEEVWPEFPKKGQLVPMGTLGISYATAGGSSQTQVQIAPTLLYLAGDHFVAGGDLVYRSLSTSGSSTTQSATGVDLMLGGAFTLGPRMSILLLPAVGFLSLSAGSSSRTSVLLGVTVPLLVHIAPHFFVGFGPQLAAEVTASQSTSGGGSTDSTKITTFNFNGFFGGWI